MTARDIFPQTLRANELYGDFWFNSEPVPVAALRGQVILVHFWDYTCSASIRSIAYVKEWGRKYRPYDLVVVGVHTPKFPFGKEPENIQNALSRLGIAYPVVMDNGGLIAARYGSTQWPTIMLIDKDGFIRYQNVGDGNYAATEHALQSLLYHAGVGEELPLIMEPLREADRPGAVLYRATPELYAGYLRGSIGNVEGYSPESVVDYADPGIYLKGRFYVDGPWMNGKDSMQSHGASAHVILDYEALEINAVLRPAGDENTTALIVQDDRPLEKGVCGDDVKPFPDGQSVLTVDSARMYNLVRNREHGRHILRLAVGTGGLLVYDFSFVASAIPELISNS